MALSINRKHPGFDQKVLDLYQQGYDLSKIARELDVNPKTVIFRAKILGLDTGRFSRERSAKAERNRRYREKVEISGPANLNNKTSWGFIPGHAERVGWEL